MELWKEVLLDWVNCTEYMDRPFFALNKISVDEFFRMLRKNQSLDHDSVYDLVIEQYPSFNVRRKGGPDEHVLVWSLLLHYTCVKSPCDDVRQNSNQLGRTAQLRMAAFFTQLLSQPRIDRPALELAITEANQLVVDESTPKLDVSFAKSPTPLRSPGAQSSVGGGSANPSPSRSNSSAVGQLVWTSSSNQGCSTPRTKMLDDWSSENRSLRAQIESERDERLFLEQQLKKQEELMEKLVSEKKALAHDYLELKNQMLSFNSENISPNKNNNDEQVKRRLRKDIQDKERQIEQLTAHVEETLNTNASLRSRVEHVDKQLFTLEQKSKEQTAMFEEQHAEIESKTQQIASLKLTNQELEAYLYEVQRSGRPSTMDLSIECGDTSMVSNYECDRSVSGDDPGSPQNLAHTVVEVQLREQQLRNQQMAEQFERERKQAAEALAKQEERVEKIRAEVNELRLLNDSMKTSCQLEHLQKLTELGEAIETMKREHEQTVSLHHLDLECAQTESNELMDQVTRLNSINQNLVQQISDKDVQIELMGVETQDLIQQRSHLKSEMDKLNEYVAQINDSLMEHKRTKISLEAEEARLRECMHTIKNQVEMLTRAKESLSEENTDVRKQLGEVQFSLKVLTEKLSSAEHKAAQMAEENALLSGSKAALQSSLDEAERHRFLLEEELARIKSLNEDQIMKISEESAKTMELGLQLTQNQTKLKCFESENELLRSKQTILSDHVKELEAAASTFERNTRDMSTTIADIKAKHELLLKDSMKKCEELQESNKEKKDITQHLAEAQNKLDGSHELLKISENSCQLLKTQLEHLSKERNELLDRTAVMDEQFARQRAEFEETNTALRRQIEDNEKMLADMRIELNSISESLVSDCKEINDLKSSKLELVEQIEATKSKLAGVTNEYQALFEQHQHLSQEFSSKSAEVVSLQEKSTELQAQYDQCSMSLQDQKKEHNVMMRNIKNLTDEKIQLELSLSNNAGENHKLGKELHNCKREIEELMARHISVEAEYKAKVARLENKLKESVDRRDRLEKEVSNLNSVIEQLNIRQTQAQEAHDETIRSLKQSRIELESQLSQQQETVTTNMRLFDEQHVALEQIRLEKEELVAAHTLALKVVENQMKQSESKLNEVQFTYERNSEEIARITDELQRITKERDDLTETDKMNQITTEKLALEISNTQEAHRKQEAEHQAIIDKLNSRVESLNSQIVASEQTHSKLLARFEDKQAEFNKQVDMLALLTDSVSSLELKCQELETKLRNQQESHEDLMAVIQLENDEQKSTIEKIKQESTEHANALSLELTSSQTLMAAMSASHLAESASLQSKLQQTSEQSKEVARLLELAQSSNATLAEEKNQLTDEVEELRRQITSQTLLLTTHQDQFVQNEAALKVNQLQKENCEAELRLSAEKVAELLAQIEQLKSANATITQDLEEKSEEMQRVKEQIDAVTEELAASEALIAQLKLEKTTLNDEITALTETIRQLEATKEKLIEDSTKNLGQTQSEHQELVDAAKALEDEIEGMRTSMQAVESERDLLVVANAEITKLLDENTKELGELSTEFSEQNQLLAQQTEMISQKSAAVQKLRESLEQQAIERDQMTKANQEHLDATMKELAEQRELLKAAVSKSQDLSEKLAVSQSQLEELTTQFSENAIVLDCVSTEKNIMEKRLADSQSKCVELEEAKSWLEASMATCSERIAQLDDEKQKMIDSAAETAMLHQKLVADLEQSQSVTRMEHDQWVAKLAECLSLDRTAPAKDDITVELKRLQDGQLELQTALAQTQELKAQVEALTKQIAAQGPDVAELQQQLAEKQTLIDEQKTQTEELVAAKQEHIHSIAILRSKLVHQRDLQDEAEKMWLEERHQHEMKLQMAEKRVTETRSELEGKLEKMKGRMKTLYTDESQKIKAKHECEIQTLQNLYENQVFELRAEKHRLEKQIGAHDLHIRKLSNQIFQLNDQALELKTSNEAMRTKLLFIENNPHVGRQKGRESRVMPSSSTSLTSLINMEDEEGEQFTNTYLNEMLTGRPTTTSTPALHSGRESAAVPLSELKMRNSQVPPHMRCSYAAQYSDPFTSEDDIKGPVSLPIDDSMFSIQSETRRGTSYQKPGPPTPSKNSGRMSSGGRQSMDPGSLALMIRNEPNGGEPDAAHLSRSPPATSKLRAFFGGGGAGGGGDKSTRRGGDENATPKRRLSLFKRKPNQ